MKADKSNFATGIGTQLAVPFAAEAELQGVTGVVWSCSTCYSKDLAKNPVLEGTWVDSNYIPFEEANTNATVKAFVKYVKNPDQYAVPGWTATLAFADAARAVVAKRGVNGLTRASFLKDGIPTLDKFNAGGMIGTIDIPSKVPSHCYVMMHLQSGKYVRVHPTKKGTFDCSPKNASVTKADLLGQ
jgi:hypothetical protein